MGDDDGIFGAPVIGERHRALDVQLETVLLGVVADGIGHDDVPSLCGRVVDE